MTQITKKQHFVPKFYLKRFAKAGQIQVFDVRARRIGKPRPYVSVCYEKFFYAAETGVQDEISQAFEDVFEKMIAEALPGIIERADAQKLTNGDLDMLAYFMSVQWLRPRFFRERLQKIRSEFIKSFSCEQPIPRDSFKTTSRKLPEAHEVSKEKLREAVNRLIESGEYDFRETN